MISFTVIKGTDSLEYITGNNNRKAKYQAGGFCNNYSFYSFHVKVAPNSFLTAHELVSKSRDGASFKKYTRKSCAT